jgi:hypothetical protein
MSTKLLFAACLAATSTVAFGAGPFDAFKGKMKEGLYENKMEMEMPGMPQGMGKHAMTFQNCVTAQDIEAGKVGKSRDNQMPENCEVRNFKMSGNTASYTMACKGEMAMTADTRMTFTDNGYRMDMKMAMNQGGQVMNMTQKMEGRYLGPCKK